LFNNLKYLIHFANLKIRVKTAVFLRGNNPIFCNRFVNRGEGDGGSFDIGGSTKALPHWDSCREGCLETADNGNSIGKDFADKNVPYLLTNSKSYCKRWDKAQATVEYAIVLIILVIACIGVIALFSGALGAMFNKLASTRAGLLGVGP